MDWNFELKLDFTHWGHGTGKYAKIRIQFNNNGRFRQPFLGAVVTRMAGCEIAHRNAIVDLSELRRYRQVKSGSRPVAKAVWQPISSC
jgi:hypothetical protein